MNSCQTFLSTLLFLSIITVRWSAAYNPPYSRRIFEKKMLIRKTAKTLILKKERRAYVTYRVSRFSVCNHF